jgi:putative ABC transport system ATP-binding protein
MGSQRNIVSLTNIGKIYGSGALAVPVLHGINLEVEAGEFIAIMGPSGSGKTTLMNILGCLDRPTTGSYRLLGREVSSLSRSELADVRNRTLGFVFQNYSLLARTTALENVELPLLYAGLSRREIKRRAREALLRVSLGDRLTHMPNQLSGGQQQRVAIARAIVNRPQVILADEPTGNLDSRTSIEILALFQELGDSGITIVIVTHEPDVAAHAQRVLMVKDGVVQEDRRQVPVRAAPQAEQVA